MKPYTGDAYWDLDAIEAWCHALAESAPRWVRVRSVGTSHQGRPLLLVTVADHDADPDAVPAFWLDGGTHCAEWTGVMACVYTLSRWVEALLAGDEATVARFERSTALVMPCVSPDGYAAMRAGAPFIRSSLRPPRDSRPRVGLDPCDVDGDGRVLWMRWKSPSGPWIFDRDNPIGMRHRTLDDDPDQAYFVCTEGQLLDWDGVRWTEAPRENGIDLNRNFPSSWAPFQMFGMDGGAYPLSEPESRAVVDTFAAHPRIAAALTNHTYTGCLLTQPYRDPSPLTDLDLRHMERLAEQSTAGTGYAVKRVVPDFTYDPKKPIIGVWADAISTTFGVPGYTLELWDPYGHNGLTIESPAAFFLRPDLELVGQLVDGFYAKDPACVVPWTSFDHPQLGAVEIGGLDYMHTVRNPPVEHLAAELDKGFTIADRLLRSLPQLVPTLKVETHGEVQRVQLVLENRGYLGTATLQHARDVGAAPPVTVTLDGLAPIEGSTSQQLGWIDGWGDLQTADANHAVYPALPKTGGVHAVASWVLPQGPFTVRWDAGRGGAGSLSR